MPMYLVVHTPRTDLDESEVLPPTQLAQLARDHGGEDARTRWITSYSPDLRDERHFTLWHAKKAEDILEVMSRYHFLTEMEHYPVCVQEWSPQSVLDAERPE